MNKRKLKELHTYIQIVHQPYTQFEYRQASSMSFILLYEAHISLS